VRLPRFAVPIVLLLLIFAGVATFLAAQWSAASRSRALTDQSHRVVETTLSLLKDMVDAETGQRGFLLTGDEAYLAPLRAAEISIPLRFGTLETLSTETPEHRARLRALSSLWAQRVALLKDSIDQMRSGDLEAARAIVASARGKDLMDRIRSEADAIQSAERTLLTERLAASDRSRDRLGIVLSLVLVLAALGMVASVLALSRRAATLVRDVQSQRQLARSLEEATVELAGEVTSVRAELSDTALRFDAALRTAPIVITSQDRELRYLWMRNSLMGRPPEWFIGRTDAEVMPEPARSRLVAGKEEALRTGEAKSFEIFVPGMVDGEGAWYDIHVEPTRDAKGSIDGVTAVAMEVTERKKRESHVRLLMRELAHRSKNTLAVTQAMARQTAANSASLDEFLERFGERLDALGRAHGLLVNEGWTGARIEDLVRSQLGHYSQLAGRQIFMSGPDLTLPTEMIQNIGLALHELATNAAKYGALSTPEGRVDITWTAVPRQDGSTHVTIGWTESGGPPVSPPTHRGFGQIVIERTVARAVGGTVELDYRPEGLAWTLSFVLDADANPAAGDHSAAIA
jgi:PAS domain S-box-containing protein